MKIKHTNTKEGGFFEAIDTTGVPVGKMTYLWNSSSIFIIDGTEVSKELKGKGIGKQLVMASVIYARENNFKIVPKCPFVVAFFERIKSIHDVLFVE